MVNIDLPVALAIFLVFFVTAVVVVVNHFSNMPSLTKIQEFREKAVSLYDVLFKTKGPQDWEQSGVVPSAPGVMIDLRKIPVLVTEEVGLSRTNEPVEFSIIFDDDCVNITWNNTVRVYDNDLNETAFNFTEQNFCSSQFLKNASIVFNINISAGESKRFEIYFSDDQNIRGSNGTVTYSTADWIPNSGDAWTEATTNWARYGGSSSAVAVDTGNKKTGSASINITDTFDSQSLGLEYNPSSNITGISNGRYLRAWILVDNIDNLNSINVSVSDNSNTITLNVLGSMSNNTWYLFEKNISDSVWANWSNFNASNGIDFVRFFATNATTGLTRTLKIDGLRFEKAPLETTIFPEETVEAISYSKVRGLRDLNSEEITSIGEGYRFMVEIEKQ